MATYDERMIAAFVLGLTERAAGYPLIAHFEDDDPCDLCYYAGYDPHDELRLVLPQYREEAVQRVKDLEAASGRAVPDVGTSPRNRCEFTVSS